MSKLINYKLDSSDEEYFYEYLKELHKYKLIIEIVPHRITYKIFDKVIVNNKKLIGDKYYTPDFIFKIDNKLNDIFYVNHDGYVYVEVKGENTSRFNTSYTFPDRQAMMWIKHSIYVQKVIPHIRSYKTIKNCLFKSTFVPKSVIDKEKYKRGVNKGKTKIVYPYKTIKEFINELNK
jgi:hypothetical protein